VEEPQHIDHTSSDHKVWGSPAVSKDCEETHARSRGGCSAKANEVAVAKESKGVSC
jgi:hypothetical protein